MTSKRKNFRVLEILKIRKLEVILSPRMPKREKWRTIEEFIVKRKNIRVQKRLNYRRVISTKGIMKIESRIAKKVNLLI